MNTERKTYMEIVETEAVNTKAEFFVDKNNCLLFWDDLTLLCSGNSEREYNNAKTPAEKKLIRNTIESEKPLYFQIKDTDKFVLRNTGNKIIDCTGKAQTLEALINKEIKAEIERGKAKGIKADTMKHSLLKRVHTYKSLIQLMGNDTIFLFPSRNNDTKSGGMLELLTFRLSNILSKIHGGTMKGTFIFYMEKPELLKCKESFKQCKSLLK